MAFSLITKFSVNVSSRLIDTLDLNTVEDHLRKAWVIDLLNGTGSGQATQNFHDVRTVTTGATDTIDLVGVLENGIRQQISLTALKAFAIYSHPANSTILSVTRPATNGVPIFAAASDACPVGPGGLFLWTSPAAGVTVTGATGDLIDIVNAAGASATYDIVVVGVQ